MPLKKKFPTHKDRSEVSDEGQFASTNQNM